MHRRSRRAKRRHLLPVNASVDCTETEKASRRHEAQLHAAARVLGRIAKHVRFSRKLPAQVRKAVQSSAGRKIGASDRRNYSEIAYSAIRYWPLVEKVWTYISRRRAVECAVFLAMRTPDTAKLKDYLVHHLSYPEIALQEDAKPRDLLDALRASYTNLIVEPVKPHRQHGGDVILPLEQACTMCNW